MSSVISMCNEYHSRGRKPPTYCTNKLEYKERVILYLHHMLVCEPTLYLGLKHNHGSDPTLIVRNFNGFLKVYCTLVHANYNWIEKNNQAAHL